VETPRNWAASPTVRYAEKFGVLVVLVIADALQKVAKHCQTMSTVFAPVVKFNDSFKIPQGF
jgi:hypothetical protein